jgi:pimeloyl-ACP methyl ester carboxylesterase
VEPAENFQTFFNRKDNKIRDVRNVWLLNYRNQGGSDHHDSYDMDCLSNDIVRFMDEKKITMATIGGHGFGAKVAAATAINNLNRFTGVI